MVSTWIWDACLQQFQWKADGAFSEYFILHTKHCQTWFTRLPGSVPRQPPVKNGWLFHLGIYLVMPGAICVLCGGTWSSEKMLQDTTSWLLRCLVFSILHSPTLLRVQYSLYLPEYIYHPLKIEADIILCVSPAHQSPPCTGWTFVPKCVIMQDESFLWTGVPPWCLRCLHCPVSCLGRIPAVVTSTSCTHTAHLVTSNIGHHTTILNGLHSLDNTESLRRCFRHSTRHL